MSGSPERRTKARTVLSITIARLLSVILGLTREVLASAYYGTSAQFSAFAIAFQVPTTSQILIGDGGLSSAVLPILVEYDEEGNIEAFASLVSRLLLMLTVTLVVVSFIFFLAAPPLFELFLGGGFSDSIRHLTIDLSQLLFPVVILLGAQSLAVAVLNSHNRFTIAAYAPAVWNIAVVALLVILHPHFHGDHAIYAYAIAVLAGSAAQVIWLLPGLRLVSWKALKSKATDRGVLRRILIRIAPVAFVAAVWQGDLIINLVVGSAVSEAAPRALQAAQRLSTVGAGLVSAAISTVAFPAFRRHALRGEQGKLAGLIERSMRMNITLLAPVSAIIIVVATPFTAVMYERGEFGAHSTELVASALVWIIVSLPAGGIWDLLTKACFAADSYWPAAFVGMVGLILDLVMSIVFQKLFGISGIALASTASFTIATVIMAIYVRARLIPFQLGQVFWSALRLAVAAGAAVVLASLLVGTVVSSGTGEFGDDVIALIATGALAMVFYGGAIRLISPADSSIFWFQLGRAMPGRLRSRRGGADRP